MLEFISGLVGVDLSTVLSIISTSLVIYLNVLRVRRERRDAREGRKRGRRSRRR